MITRKSAIFLLSRVVMLTGLICALLFAGPGRRNNVKAQEPQQGEVIRIDTNLISVPVIVSDRLGHYIPDLRESEFKLYDDDVEQKISFFDAAEAPLNIVLLLDTSLSTAGALDNIKKAAKEFLKELRPQDRAEIVTFDHDVAELSALTADRKELEAAIKRVKVTRYQGTLLNDAVLMANDKILQPVNGRKAIIVLSDGDDRGSQNSNEDVLAVESEADAMVYSVYFSSAFRGGSHGGFGFPGGRSHRGRPLLPVSNLSGAPQQRGWHRGRRDDGAEYLEQLSEVTGGHFYRSSDKDLKESFSQIAEELRHQYRIGFYPGTLARDGNLHRLKVRVDRTGVAVRSRQNYRMKPGAAGT
jgi:Ca-activated chloride channel homolog